MAHKVWFCVELSVVLDFNHCPPPPPLLLPVCLWYCHLYAMPKVHPRNKVGAIIHAIMNRVLSNHTTRNICGIVNYAKTFIQSTVVNVFDQNMLG
jgi:hypothetical protein